MKNLQDLRIICFGDIHGRDVWKEVVDKEINNTDLFIFLGDYFTSREGISIEAQKQNFIDIVDFKNQHPDKVYLLRGNHDMEACKYYWAECSGFDYEVANYMRENKDRFLSLTQWIYIHNNIIFSHAGISNIWLNNIGCTIENINNLQPSEIFGFTPNSYNDIYGTSVTQPLTWIRPQTLATCNIIDYDQIIGHTPIKKIVNMKKCTKQNCNIFLCDTLGHREYLVIEDNKFIPKTLPK